MSDQRLEWLKLRKLSIGSSDAPALYGKSPYLTELELYNDKITEEVTEESSYVMEMGNRLEPEARKLFAASYNIVTGKDETFSPKMLHHKDYSFISASLDGINEAGTEIIEIKYQGKDVHLAGTIKENYLIQMQHQLFVSGAEFCWFISYNPAVEPKLKYVKVERDDVYYPNHLRVCLDFWSKVVNKTPPEPSQKDYVTLTKKGMKAKAELYASLHRKLKDIETEMDKIKAEILESVNHDKMRCGGLRIDRMSKIGSISYKDIPAIKEMTKSELDKYRGKSSDYYKITIEE